jgi:Ca2+-binding EF-hand superfamily protein
MPTSAFKQNARISRSPSGRTADKGQLDGAASQAYDRIVQQRMADKNVQQLRGIFAGFDLNRDNALQRDELVNALLSLGVKPTKSLLQEYFQASTLDGKVDLRTFIDTSMSSLQDAGTVFEDVLSVFSGADTRGSGRVGVPELRHLLQNVQTGSQLSETETEDFLKMIGISDLLTQAKRSHQTKVDAGKVPRGATAPSEADFEVNYGALIDDMLFVDKEHGATKNKNKGKAAGRPI